MAVTSNIFTKKLPPDAFVAYLKENYTEITDSTDIEWSADAESSEEKTITIEAGITQNDLDTEISNYSATAASTQELTTKINGILTLTDYIEQRYAEETRLIDASVIEDGDRAMTLAQVTLWYNYRHTLRGDKDTNDPDNYTWPTKPSSVNDGSLHDKIDAIING